MMIKSAPKHQEVVLNEYLGVNINGQRNFKQFATPLVTMKFQGRQLKVGIQELGNSITN